MEKMGNDQGWLCKDVEPFPMYPDYEGCGMVCGCGNNPETQNADRESRHFSNLPEQQRVQLLYQSCQRAMDVEAYRAKREMDIVYDERKHKQKLDKALEKEILSYEVFKGGCGELFFAQIAANDRRVHIKKLCNIIDIVAKIMYANGRKMRRVMHLAWYGNPEGVCFRLGNEGISSKKFCRTLKAQGVSFQVSRRCGEEVMDALLAYLLNNAETIEIPDKKGWNRMLDGRLHFANKNEITMSEVWENAI